MNGRCLWHQSPVAVLDLEHAERGEIEAKVVSRRHVHYAAGADEALGLLDLVAQLGLIPAAGALGRLNQNHQSVISMATKGRDRLAAGSLLIGLLVVLDDQ